MFDLKYKFQKKISDMLILMLSVTFILITPSDLYAQRIIQGTVVSAENGANLSGVIITVKGTSIGSTTNSYGKFSITINSRNDVLIFSYSGKQTLEIGLTSEDIINVKMFNNHSTIEEQKYLLESLKINVDKPGGFQFGDYYFHLIYSYQQTKFYASRFSEQLDNGAIKIGYGDSYTLRQGWYPFMIDVSGFISRYNSTLSQKTIKFRGLEVDMSTNIPGLPKYFLRPYLGIGYQLSQVDDNESFVNTSQLIWKAGIVPIKIYISRHLAFFFTGEYKQSLDASSPYAFNQFSVGFGMKLY